MSTRPTANIVDPATLADHLAQARVIASDQLERFLADFSGSDPASFAEFLVSRGALTPFQAGRALAGEARSLVLGPYRVAGFLRAGAFGPVLWAEKISHRGTEPVALRVMPLRSLWQARQARQAVRALAALPAHPTFVPLVDAGSANGYHYLAWPLTRGTPLADRVRDTGPLPPEEATSVLARIAAGLAVCHSRRVVHGLLTPQSIVLPETREGHPQVVDLGAGGLLAANLAVEESLFDTLSSAVAVAEALGFAAPEWVADPTQPTSSADQYSLGAVAYFCLTGQRPVPDGSNGCRRIAEVAPAIAGGLAAVVDRLLSPERMNRYSGMDEVGEVLAAISGRHEPIHVHGLPFEFNSPSGSRRSGNLSDASKPGATPGTSASGTGRPPERDDSEVSVQFDLPIAPADSRLSHPLKRSSSAGRKGLSASVPSAECGPSPVPDPRDASVQPVSDRRRTDFTGETTGQPTSTPRESGGKVDRPPRLPNLLRPSGVEFDPDDRPILTVRLPGPARDSTVNESPVETDPQSTPAPSLLSSLEGAHEGGLGIELAPPPVLPAAPLLAARKPSPSKTAAPSANQQEGQSTLCPNRGGRSDVESRIWRKIKQTVLFWQASTDAVHVGVFGPASVAHSDAPRLTVFLYPPAAAKSVTTLAGAFQHEAVLLGTGVLAQRIPRGAQLVVHLATAHAVVTTSLEMLVWQGQPHRMTFDLVVPWEAPAGPALGVVSIGQNDVRIGKAEFRLVVEGR